jgi:hypothetical protein
LGTERAVAPRSPPRVYNEISRRAAFRPDGESRVKYGSDQYRETFATVTGPLSDAFAARFTGLYLDRDAERNLVSAKRPLLAPTTLAVKRRN